MSVKGYPTAQGAVATAQLIAANQVRTTDGTLLRSDGTKNYIREPDANFQAGWVASGAGVTVATTTTAANLPDISRGSALTVTRVSGTTAYVYYRFTMDPADYNRACRIYWDQIYAGTLADYVVELWSNTASNYGGTSTQITLSLSSVVSATTGFMSLFTAPSSAAPYMELRFKAAAGTTPLYLAGISVSPVASTPSYAADWTSGTSFVATHNLNTKDVEVQVYDSSTGDTIYVNQVTRTSVNVVTLTASSAAPGTGWRVLIISNGAVSYNSPASGGSGTVTSVSVTTANGVSGSVATATTTPAITLTLGAITPSSVAASGTVTGSNLSGTNTGDQTITLTGDVTGSGTGSFAATIGSNVVTNAKAAQMPTLTIKGNNTGGTANALDLTATQTTAMLDVFSSTLKGLAPLSGGGTSNFLRADGTWVVPPGTGVPTTRTISTTAPLTGGGDLSANRTFAIPASTASVDGYLAATDFVIFSAKQAAGNYITALTGDVTASGPGSSAATVKSNLKVSSFGLTIDGGGSAITTGVKGYTEIPFTGTITGWTLLGDVSGSIVIDIWKQVYASYPPTVANTITGASKPTISSALKGQNLAVSGWTTAVSAGDTIGFNVDSCSSITRVTLIVRIDRT